MNNNRSRIQQTVLLLSAMCMPALSHGEIIRHTTIGSNNTERMLPDDSNVYNIYEELGEKYGENLFHSFDIFEILSDETAHFISTDTAINNIISRVTGARPSMIDGRLISDKNFFLINPNGIIFGTNSTLDINGSLNLSTSNSLLFDNGAVFGIDQPIDTTLLSTAAPSTFGFLNESSGDIRFTGIDFTSDKDIYLHAQSIDIMDNASLVSNGAGNIMIEAADTIRINGEGSKVSSENADAQTSGNITISANKLSVEDDARLWSRARSQGDSGDIQVTADQVNLTGNATVWSTSDGSSNSGDITINSKTLAITEGSQIAGSAENSSKNGNINLFTDESITIDGDNSAIKTTVAENGTQETISGNITIGTQNLTMSDGALIRSWSKANGVSGDIAISTDNMTMANGSILWSRSNAQGTSGHINIDNNNTMELAGESDIFTTVDGGNQSGDITINSNNLTIKENSVLAGSVENNGNSGNINIMVGDTLNLDGDESSIKTSSRTSAEQQTLAGSINIDAAQINLRASSFIQTLSEGAGNSEDININADNLTMSQASTISSQTDSSGSSGDLNITISDTLKMSDESTRIRTAAVKNATNDSSSGDINLKTQNTSISDGAFLLSWSNAEGTSGDINIDKYDNNSTGHNLSVNGSGSSIQSYSSNQGTSGNISISNADDVSFSDRAAILSITTFNGDGDSGNIDIETNTMNFSNGSIISTQSENNGTSGDISISAKEKIEFTNDENNQLINDTDTLNSGIYSLSQGENNGGHINVISNQDIIFSEGATVASNSTGNGNSGSIVIDADNNLTISGTTRTNNAVDNTGIVSSAGSIERDIPNIVIDNNSDSEVSRYRIDIISNNAANPNATSNAGNINLQADTIDIINGADIGTTTNVQGDSNNSSDTGGNINIVADNDVFIGGRDNNGESATIITSTTYSQHAGDINIESKNANVRIQDGAKLLSSNVPDIPIETNIAAITSGGNTGDINIDAQKSITISGYNENPASAEIQPTTIQTISDNSSETSGSIAINATHINVSNNALINSENQGNGDGGDITMKASGSTAVIDSAITSSAGNGNGGDILINTDIGIFADSTILARGDEKGGAITINTSAGKGFKTANTIINAESKKGNEGDGIISIGDLVDIDDKTIEATLETSFIDVSSLIRKSCSADTDASQFNIFQQTGVAASPEGLLPSIDPIALQIAQLENHNSGTQAQNQGVITFRNGEFEAAKTHWTEALAYYANSGNDSERSDALRGIAQAQQAQGEYNASVTTLAQSVEIARLNGNQSQIAESLGSLGNALIASGNPGTAEEMLNQAIRISEDIQDRSLTARLRNNLGNYYSVNNLVNEALDNYLQSVEASIETDQYVEATKAYANIARLNINDLNAAKALGALQQAEVFSNALEPNADKANIHIHLAKSYNLLAESKASYDESLKKAYAHLQQAKALSKQMNDDRLLSYAVGNLGSLYKTENRPTEALRLTRQALALADNTNASEYLYRWHWQEAQLLHQLGQNQAAVDAYKRAITIIEDSRQTTLARYESADVHFKQQVQPVYKELANVLIQASVREDNDIFAQQLLLDTRDVMEQLKTAELENYFHDDCIATFDTKRKDLDQVSPKAAVVYPIVLKDRLELLISLPDLSNPYQRTLVRRAVPVSEVEIATQAQTFRGVVESVSSTINRHHQASQPFYNWLVRPYAEDLKKHNIDTLVFVPDGMLRTLPMSALHNGDNYLIEEYAVAITSSLRLTDPQPLAEKNNRVLLAGVSESVNGLPALEAVPSELGAVNELFTSKVLLDDEFTAQAFTDQVEKEDYSIIHIASHAQFTGDERSSFLQAYDQTLSLDDMSNALNTTKYREQPLEMLVLSACETASGDERSALGLAGVGIKAGARSAMGSLWSVSDDSAAKLIEQFYTELHDNKLSKAEALRQAQLTLLEQGQYADPAHWSAFMIIDNWL